MLPIIEDFITEEHEAELLQSMDTLNFEVVDGSARVVARSMYIMEGKYRDTLTHCIKKRKSDVVDGQRVKRGIRYSLTYRTLS